MNLFSRKNRTIEQLRGTVTVLLADNEQAEAKRVAAEAAQKRAETRLRDSENRLATVRARISHAARVGLLTHRGDWPDPVLDAAARAMSTTELPDDLDMRALYRSVAGSVLDAAAGAIHRDHVHVDITTTLAVGAPVLVGRDYAVGDRDQVARAAAVIAKGAAAIDRLLAGDGHDAVGTTDDDRGYL